MIAEDRYGEMQVSFVILIISRVWQVHPSSTWTSTCGKPWPSGGERWCPMTACVLLLCVLRTCVWPMCCFTGGLQCSEKFESQQVKTEGNCLIEENNELLNYVTVDMLVW